MANPIEPAALLPADVRSPLATGVAFCDPSEPEACEPVTLGPQDDAAMGRSLRSSRFVTHRLPVDAVEDAASVSSHVQSCLVSRSQCLTTFVNPASAEAATKDKAYLNSLFQFDLVLPDGVGMCAAVRLVHRTKAARISFDSTSLAPMVLKMAADLKLSVALVGGKPGHAVKAAAEMTRIYPRLRISATLDGYGTRAERVATLLAVNPDIVICGMGVGVQEATLLELKEAGWQGCGFTCGGYLDQLSEGFQYYPRWIDERNLRWVYRLYREPRRLWRRYLVQYPSFCFRTGVLVLATRAATLVRRGRPLRERQAFRDVLQDGRGHV